MTHSDPSVTTAAGRAPEKVRHGFGNYLLYLAVRAVTWPVEQAPLPASLWVARRLGSMAYALLGRHRRIALHNLRQAFGAAGWPERRIRQVAHRAFQSFLMTIVEGIKMPLLLRRGRLGELVEFTGPCAHAQEAARAGKPLVLASGHLGSWEILMGALVTLGIPTAGVVRPIRNGYIDDWVRSTRARVGQQFIYSHGALRSMRRVLGEGRSVGVLIDQNTPRGIFVDFFGRPAKTNPVVGVLAARYGHPIFVGCCQRVVPGRHYRVLCDGPIPVSAERTPEERIAAVTQECTRLLEHYVRLLPEQWFWLHRRWKDRPGGERENIV